MQFTEKHLIFRIKEQLFTISVTNVNTIIQVPRLYQVPQAPDFILGVINVDGDVIPVIDTARKLNMGEVALEEHSQVIIMQKPIESSDKLHLLGFLVDEVCDVDDVDTRKIQALPTSKYSFNERLVDGMHKINEEFCMQVNVGNFFRGEIEEMHQAELSIVK